MCSKKTIIPSIKPDILSEIQASGESELHDFAKTVDTTTIVSGSKGNLDSLSSEVKEKSEKKGFIKKLIEIFNNPGAFFSILFGKPTNTEKAENLKEWKSFKNSPMLIFFEEIKETFSLSKENTNPKEFNEKYKDLKFREIMKFQQKTKGNYSSKLLGILWINKDNIIIEDKKLKLKKKSGEIQEINTENDNSITESIVPKKSIIKKIPKFTNNLEISLTKNFSNIPQKYKKLIPEAINKFEINLKNAVTDINHPEIPRLSKTKILDSIESVYSLNIFTKPIVSSKIDNFLESAEGQALKKQYTDLWAA